MSRYNVLYLTSELFPFAKVGGLADVAGSLPKALKDLEHDIRVFLPKYKIIRDRKYNLREVIRLRDIEVPLGSETVLVSVKSGFVPDSKVQAYFLEYKPFFDRNDIYIDPKTGEGWEDDAMRFALFARAALETLKVLFWQPDLIHVNDWPSALVPYFLKSAYAGDSFFENTKTVLTIHNMAYQGDFPAEVAGQIGAEPFNESHPAWHNGRFNFLKAGIQTADLVTTVSPSYAEQIVSSPEFGHGLESVLAERREKLHGVLNGIDDNVWNPETDSKIAETYSVEEPDGKKACRTALCEELGLDNDDSRMIVGMISRLAEQKGFDLFLETAEKLLEQPVSLAILGTGQKEIEEGLKQLAEKYPGKVSFTASFDDALAHRIEAGADAFLMTSRFEPCGLNQLYSLRYGTVPIVHATGGLADTVSEYDPKKKQGNGFTFTEFTGDALTAAVEKAVGVFADKEAWNALKLEGMSEDNSWTASAKKLLDIYALATQEAMA